MKKPSKKQAPSVESCESNDEFDQSIDIPSFVRDAKSNESNQTSIINQLLEESVSTDLSSAKANWYFGEWQALIGIDIQAHSNHPDIDKLTALKAAGYQQLNDIENSKKYFQLAKKLGCDHYLISQLLIAGVHNSLGKVAALKSDDDKMLSHFTCSVDVGGVKQEKKLAVHARSVKEISRLGLLPQAAKLLSSGEDELKCLATRPTEHSAALKVLASEVEIINHELMLAYQKSQLYANTVEGINIYLPDGAIDKEALKKLSPSQLGQDLWALEQTNYKRNGFFVEFGATDGVLLSNSYLLEKEFAWQGICAEPNPKYFEQLQKNRECVTSNACIAGESGNTVEFILANEYGGIAGYANDDKHADKREAYAKSGQVIKIDTVSLHDFLIANNAPKNIDYISIDVEGGEFDILKMFPFERWKVALFSVEHNFTPNRILINDLLSSHDYICIESQFDDWYYNPNY